MLRALAWLLCKCAVTMEGAVVMYNKNGPEVVKRSPEEERIKSNPNFISGVFTLSKSKFPDNIKI